MQITITIPINRATRLVNGIANRFHYQANLVDADGVSTPNPESKNAFAKRMILNMLRTFYIDEAVRELNVADTKSTANTEFNDCSVE
jgi:hypothetical protein